MMIANTVRYINCYYYLVYFEFAATLKYKALEENVTQIFNIKIPIIKTKEDILFYYVQRGVPDELVQINDDFIVDCKNLDHTVDCKVFIYITLYSLCFLTRKL